MTASLPLFWQRHGRVRDPETWRYVRVGPHVLGYNGAEIWVLGTDEIHDLRRLPAAWPGDRRVFPRMLRGYSEQELIAAIHRNAAMFEAFL